MEELSINFPSVQSRSQRESLKCVNKYYEPWKNRKKVMREKLEKCSTSANTTLNPSYIYTPDFANDSDQYLTEQIKSKASFMMSLNRTLEAEFGKCSNRLPQSNEKKQHKLSFMITPKKKVSKINFQKTCRNRLRQRFTDRSRLIRTMKMEQFSNMIDDQIQQKQQGTTEKHIASLSHYFTLAFTKFFARESSLIVKERVTILVECLARKYKKQPQIISDDVKDVICIERIVKDALAPKQNYIELRPYQGIEINGDLARLFFNMTHLITAWRFKNYDLIKIYLQLEYYSRKLQFHELTLRFCFQIGDIFSLRHDQENSYKYYGKAMKLAIFMGDTFNQEKAIDRLGLSTYGASQIGFAHYFHQNMNNLSQFDRQVIRQNYSNQKQIQLLVQMRKKMSILYKNKQSQQPEQSPLYTKKRQNYNFSPQIEYPSDYQLKNRDKFQKKISKFIATPQMREKTLIAKNHLLLIDKIGKVKRLKNWDGRLLKGCTNFKRKQSNSNQVLLTHRSLNRVNPQYQLRQIKRQKNLLIELIGYYTNSMIDCYL